MLVEDRLHLTCRLYTLLLVYCTYLLHVASFPGSPCKRQQLGRRPGNEATYLKYCGGSYSCTACPVVGPSLFPKLPGGGKESGIETNERLARESGKPLPVKHCYLYLAASAGRLIAGVMTVSYKQLQ